jgi:16S rRNA (uracil1498-N3)-methyltransferase
MSRRFFVDSPVADDHARLVGSEADHLVRVLRGKVGEEVVLFDGTDAEYRSRIVSVGRSRVDLQVLERREIDREVHPQLLLAVALPKGDRQRWLIEKSVELGVAHLIPLMTERGVAQPVDRALERLRRAVIEAAKQCGRNRLMTIAQPQTVADCLSAAPPDCRRWLVHPSDASRPLLELFHHSGRRSILAVIGPEGGFTEQETAACGPECQWLTLGPRTLRIETAALAVASAVALLRCSAPKREETTEQEQQRSERKSSPCD